MLKEISNKKRKVMVLWISMLNMCFVTSFLVDPERTFGGWVNCNELIPTTSRNELVKDKIYDDFLNHLKQYSNSISQKRRTTWQR